MVLIKMDFYNEWEVEDGYSSKEARKLKQYFDEKRGLIFTQFNTTQGVEGKLRSLDAIRFPNQEKEIYKAKGNYENIAQLIEEQTVELIEVHKWGFYRFGQLIGKSEIVKKYWNPKRIKKVLITLSPTTFQPEKNPDPPTEEVFEKFGITVFTPTENKKKKT